MKRRILKWPLSHQAPLHLTMPRGSRILHADMQQGQLQVWVEEIDDPENNLDKDLFIVEIFGTGFYVPEDAEYVSTVQDPPFIWHVYYTMVENN